jgi:hypothetical protein
VATVLRLARGAAGFKVRAIWQADPAVRAERSGSFSQAYETIEGFDLDLSVAAVTGQVSFDGGTEAVVFPLVFVTTAGVADPRTYYADQSNADGTFSVLVGGAGDYLVTGQDFDSGLTGQASAHVPDLATGAHVPVELPPSGSVTVTLSGLGGAPASPQRVALSSRGLAFDRDGYFGESSSLRSSAWPWAASTCRRPTMVSAARPPASSQRGDSRPSELPETTWLEGQVFGPSRLCGCSSEAWNTTGRWDPPATIPGPIRTTASG